MRNTEVVYRTLADFVLAAHLLWIIFVIAGAALTRGRRALTGIHVAALAWGIIVEAGPWPCPLTLLESFLEAKAGIDPYRGGFLLHYLDALVYPDIPGWVLAVGGVGVCAFNLAIYGRRLARNNSRSRLKVTRVASAGRDRSGR